MRLIDKDSLIRTVNESPTAKWYLDGTASEDVVWTMFTAAIENAKEIVPPLDAVQVGINIIKSQASAKRTAADEYEQDDKYATAHTYRVQAEAMEWAAGVIERAIGKELE